MTPNEPTIHEQTPPEEAAKMPAPEPHATDHVSVMRTIAHCACEYGLLAGGVLAVILTATILVRKARSKK